MWSYNYDNELYHYGVLGMKWGRRRYQNKDGSLTPAGKKHIREKGDSYLNTRYGDKHAKNRQAVAKEFADEHRKVSNTAKAKGIALYDPQVLPKYNRVWNSFLDKYADATLKDLGYKNTEAAKNFVKSLYDQSLIYSYDVYDKYTGKKVSSNYEGDAATVSDLSKEHNWEFKKKELVL